MFLLLFLCDLLYLTVFIFFSKIKHHSLGVPDFSFLRISEQYTCRDELGVPKALYLFPSEDARGPLGPSCITSQGKTKSICSIKETIKCNVC